MLLLQERLFGLLEGIACRMIQRLVIFHLTLQGVAGAGDIYYASLMCGLDMGAVIAFAVGSALGQFKEAVHGYCQAHPALRYRLRGYQSGHCRSRVALL